MPEPRLPRQGDALPESYPGMDESDELGIRAEQTAGYSSFEEVQEKYLLEIRERKEREPNAVLQMKFNHATFKDLIERPDFNPNLAELAELFMRLPEQLSFQPGLNLIVGDNGAGKSTLAKGIYLAVKARQWAEFVKTMTVRDLESFQLADKRAIDQVFYQDSDPQHQLWLRMAGLGFQLGQSLEIADYLSHRRVNNIVDYLDFGEIFGKARQAEIETFNYAFDGHTQAETYRHHEALREGRSYTKQSLSTQDALRQTALVHDHMSHRQTVDATLSRRQKHQRLLAGTIEFFDEPETGLSPRRHHRLQDELSTLMSPGSIAIVPTNSVVLFDSDLPRIDLDYPERGIHHPSQYSPDIRD